MPRVVEAAPQPGYKLRLTFDDGVSGVVDVSHLVGQGVFQHWSAPGAFERVAIGSGGELLWDDQVDLCPDAIYMEITGKSPEEVFPNLADLSSHA